MTAQRASIETSYAHCRRLVRRSRSSFSPAFLLLSGAKRRGMEALYAFMRHTDDLADSPQPPAFRRAALVRWRAALDARLACPGGTGEGGRFASAEEEHAAVSAILPAVADTVERFAIPPQLLHAVIDGVEMDLTQDRYATMAELETYCERVASAVGLACIHVWGIRGEGALEPARRCGLAVQLTNILRDLGEDAQRGRIYLPLEDLAACGYTPDDLFAGVVDRRFLRLVEHSCERAEGHYLEGSALHDFLYPDGQRVCGMMMDTYHRLLAKVRRHANEIFKRRLTLDWRSKAAVGLRWFLLPPRKAAVP